MILRRISAKSRLIILTSLLILLIVSYMIVTICNVMSLKRYDKEILPNTYIGEFDMSLYSFENSIKKIDFYNDYILSQNVKLQINSKIYEYSLLDLGIIIDKEKTINNIKNYQDKLSYSQKLVIVNGVVKKEFDFVYKVDDSKLIQGLTNLKGIVDQDVVDGYFDVSEGVKYNKGVDGYSLNIADSLDVIKKAFSKGFICNEVIKLTGDTISAGNDEGYDTIDTLTSSFETVFTPNTYLRNKNLNTALGYINGTIVMPGEVFSYCNKAGPFNKSGYVFYYEFVGNGVCQIATTTYNAALLGGLEIVKRYPHAKKSAYVAGGLDATVASYSSGWCVDMQFKNTYKYPIYIKAYSENGKAHVEFWSNSQAKEGKEYTTESVKIGNRGYKSYLHTFKDGVEIDKKEIATTWYSEE